MIRGIILAFLLLTQLNTNAQEEWDIERCIDYAWENSLNIKQAVYGVEFEEVNKNFNKHQRYPDLSGSANMSLNFGRSLDITTDAFTTESILSTNYGLNTGVLLWNAGRINKSINQSDLDVDAAMSDLEQTKRDIALNVGIAYLNALFAEENLVIGQNSLDLSKEQLNQIDKLIAAGSRPRNDRLDIVAQMSNDEQQIVTFENNVAIAILNLKQLMNLDVETEITLVPPPETLLLDTDPDDLGFAQVYDEALKHQPNILAGEARLRSAEIGVEIANTGKYPSLFANGSIGTAHSNRNFLGQSYFDQLDQNLRYGLGIGANIPIYDNYAAKSNVQRAEINVLTTQAQNEQLNQTLRTNVQQSISDARAAKRALQASEKTVEAREAAFENAEKRFNLGAINTFEYVNTKNQYESSKVNYIISKYDYLFKIKIVDFYMGKSITLD